MSFREYTDLAAPFRIIFVPVALIDALSALIRARLIGLWEGTR